MIKICKQCGNDFEAATAWRRLCDECRELNEKEHNRHKDEIEAKRQAREEARQRRQAEKETPKPRPRRNPEYKNFRKAIDRAARAKRFGFAGIKRRFSAIEITKCLHGFNCAVCHFEKSAKFNEVHHITPIKDFQSVQEANNLNNLICLCPTCHKKADMGLIPKETLRKLADDAQYELSDHVIDAMNSGRDVPKEWAPVLYEYARELKEYS